MKTYDAKDIRNVLLVGHGGAGKTTLLEALLFASGGITRMGTVEDGNTVSDHDPDEQRRGISVSLAMAPVEWKGVKINALDAPGTADFVGEFSVFLASTLTDDAGIPDRVRSGAPGSAGSTSTRWRIPRARSWWRRSRSPMTR